MKPDVEITWLGHAALSVRSGAVMALIDPFLTGNPAATTLASELSPTVILITHAHNDHVGDAVEISRRVGCNVLATAELADYLASQGVATTGGHIGGTVAFDGGTMKFVPAIHSSSYRTGSSVEALGAAAGILLRVSGKAIYIAGDTALFGDMLLIGDAGIDIAFLPIGGLYTMDQVDAVAAVKLIRPKVVVPYHFGTFPQIAQDPQSFASMVQSQTSSQCVVLKVGESVAL